jgi:hypothetical protein
MTQTGISTSYRDLGYAISAEPVVPSATVDAARAGMDAIRRGEYDTGRPPCESPWKPGGDPNVLCKIENPQFASRGICDLLTHPALGEWVAAITGAAMIQVWWVQLLYKPPALPGAQVATGVGWHLDWTYWRTSWAEGSELFTIWLALSDVAADCGPMQFVDGSNHWPDLEGGDFFAQRLSSEGFSVPDGATWQETPALMRAGGCSVHDKLTLHGSGPNSSDRPRRSLAIHCRSERSRPALRDGTTRVGLTTYIDDFEVCPIIYGDRVAKAF